MSLFSRSERAVEHPSSSGPKPPELGNPTGRPPDSRSPYSDVPRNVPISRPILAHPSEPLPRVDRGFEEASIRGFTQFGLDPRILRVLPESGLQAPSDFEDRLLPAIARGESIWSVAPGGTARIPALMLPIFNALLERPPHQTAVVILCPTDGAGLRLWKEMKPFTHALRFWTAGVFACTRDEHLRQGFKYTPAIIVATPAGLLRGVQSGYAALNSVKTLLLDEVLPDDRLLHELPPRERLQTILLSASPSPEAADGAVKLLPAGKIYNAIQEVFGEPLCPEQRATMTSAAASAVPAPPLDDRHASRDAAAASSSGTQRAEAQAAGREVGLERRGPRDCPDIPPHPEAITDVAFDLLGLDSRLLRAVTARGFVHPTEIQNLLIPAIDRGESVLGLAPTGSGKTAAYLLPLLNGLLRRPSRDTAALILAPTDVLGEQLAAEFRSFRRQLGVSVACVFDNTSEREMRDAFKRTPSVIIGTPRGVLAADDRNVANLVDLRLVVLDEADTLLVSDAMRELMPKLPSFDDLQSVLISATLSPEMEGRVTALLPGGKIYNANYETPVQQIKHSAYRLLERQKFPMLLHLIIDQHAERLIAFCETPGKCEFLTERLRQKKIRCAAVHQETPALDRSAVMEDFRDGQFPVLVATGEIARGLDVRGVSHVVHIDLPSTLDEYRHRAGRTGRAGQEGRSVIFALPWEEWDTKAMFNMLKIEGDWPPKPDLLTPLDDRFRLDFGPQDAIETGQAGLGYTFQRPALLLTAFNRNRFYEDPREKVTMLNLVGRALVPVALSDLLFEHAPGASFAAWKELTSDFGHGRMIQDASVSLGLDRFSPPDKPADKIFGEYTPNVEQTFYNCLGAIFLDSGSTAAVKSAVARALLPRMIERLSRLARYHAATDYSLGAAARLRFEHALGHTFSHTSWLDEALEGFRMGDTTREFSSRLLVTGAAVMYLVACDILRRGCFDWSSKDIREKKGTMNSLEGVWESPKAGAVSVCLQETFGWRDDIGKVTIRDVLRSLAGALYADAGYEAAARFVSGLFPDADELISSAKSRVRINADLPALQEQLDLEGELRDKRLASRQLAEQQRELAIAEAAARASHTTEPDRYSGRDYKAELDVHVKTGSMGKLRYRVSPSTIDGVRTFAVSITLGKTTIAETNGHNQEFAMQEAARLALERIGG